MKHIAVKMAALGVLALPCLTVRASAQTERDVQAQAAKAHRLELVTLAKRADSIGSRYLSAYEVRKQAAQMDVSVQGVAFHRFYEDSMKDKEIAFWRTLEEGRQEIRSDPKAAQSELDRAEDLARDLENMAQPYVSAAAAQEGEFKREREAESARRHDLKKPQN